MQSITDHQDKLSGFPGTGGKIAGEDVFIFPATVAQYRFWLLDKLQPGNPALNVPLAARLTGRLDEELMERAVNEIVRRHEILCTSFQLREGELVQIVHSAKEIPVARFDLTQVPESNREAKINELLVQEGKIPFDLANGPLLRAGLMRIQEEEYILLLTMHHIGSDGWSNGVVIREVAQIYDALRESRPLPELPLQYADFAVWQQEWLKTPAAQAEREFWRARLQGILPCLNLPTDYPRKPSRGNDSTIHTLLLPGQLTDRLKSYCHSENLTLFMVFCTVYAILLRRYSGQKDITIGTPVANRNQPDLEGLIGLFSNPLLLRLKFPPDLTLHGLMNQIKSLSLEVMEHQAYPFEKVVEEIQTDPSRAGLPWLQAYMVFQKAFMLPQQMAGVRLTPMRSISPGAMFDWMLGVLERAEGIRLQMEYNIDLFDQATIDQVLHQFQYLLERVAEGRDFPVDELPLLTSRERQQLVVDWNKASPDWPAERPVHEQFEEQVRLTPNAPAFQSGENSTSYAALNFRANQLAHFLQSQGLKSGSQVGLVMSQGSIEFVVSFLAVLKAGGCCLASHLPDEAAWWERLTANSQLALVIRGDSTIPLPPAANCQIIDLAEAAELIGSQASHNPSVPVAGEAPAWVVFTTRSRRGAVIRHRALSHSTSVARREFGLTSQDTVAFSLAEWFPALLSGAKLAGRTGAEKFSASDWWQWVRDQGITAASLPSTGWQELVRFLHSDETKVAGPLRLLAIDGGLISPHALLAWHKMAAGKIRVVDRFWLSEAAGAIAYTEPFTTGSAPGRVSLMRPVSDIRCYLLDEHLQPVPKGVPGNLYVESEYLAVDYIASPTGPGPDFAADSISGKAGSRLLKTGDTGRFLNGGGIELLGQIDELAKTNGFRLELGEIRFTMLQHPAIWDARLVPRNSSGKNGLVAYWINRENTLVQPRELRAFLEEKLPAYMVPDALIQLKAWPLTGDGRLDFDKLPLPNTTRQADVNGAYVEAIPEDLPAADAITMTSERRFLERQNYWEQVLGKFWRDALKLKRIKVTDNFFALGGHSLLAIRLITEINQNLKTKLHIPAFFQNPTIEKLAVWFAREQPLKPAPELVSLQPGRNEGALFFLEASIGLCRLAELIEVGPASFTTLAPLTPEAYRAALADDFSQLPDLETLCAPHTAMIQNHSFSGPCILVGHSFGGLLTFEVARQLQRAGRRVDLVLVLDTWAKNPPWWQKLRTVTWKNGWESLSFRLGRLWRRDAAKLSGGAQTDKVTTEKSKVAEPAKDGFHLPYAEADWNILSKINRKARRDYQFRPLESRGILFRAKNAESTRFLRIDGSMGWSGLFKDGLEIMDCPGDHLTLLKSPNIQFLAQQIQQSIEKLSINKSLS